MYEINAELQKAEGYCNCNCNFSFQSTILPFEEVAFLMSYSKYP
jgi:hypothetical protein